MTKYLVSGYIGFDNFGDEAIAGVLVKHLKNIGAEKITLISSNPGKTEYLYGVDTVGMFDFLQPLFESDILISGGGSLLQDVTSFRSLFYYLLIIMTALLFNKKVIIFAQGFTPFKTKIGEFLTKFVLRRCSLVTVRDVNSRKMLSGWNIPAEVVSDPVFGIEIPEVKEKHGAGVQLRGCEGLTDEFLAKLAQEIKNRFKNEEVTLISLQDSIDLPILEKFSKMVPNCRIVKNLTVSEALAELSGLEYLIGMRFHACLAGVKAGVKVLGIDYDIKVKTLAQETGFALVELTGENMSESFDKMFSINPYDYKIPEFNCPELG